MRLSLCIPIYNEKANIAASVSAYKSALYDITGGDFELIYCDDGSTDGCADTVRDETDGHIRLTGYEKNRGKGCAVRTAIEAASGDVIIYTDCDNAYGTETIKRALDYMEENPETDVLIGSRRLGEDGYAGYSVIRKLASEVYVRMLKLIAGFHHSDSQCGFKAFRGTAAHDIFPRCVTDGFAFDIEALLFAERLGYRIDEFPVRIINHSDATSKIHIFKDTFRMLCDVLKIKKHIKASL
ncbi:MAG: glycosyltransferase [Firmicutes bacterium]|nr:glycosyltransferase [Bacillota bacterium]